MGIPHLRFDADMHLCVSDIHICAYIFQIRINLNVIYAVYANVRMFFSKSEYHNRIMKNGVCVSNKVNNRLKGPYNGP